MQRRTTYSKPTYPNPKQNEIPVPLYHVIIKMKIAIHYLLKAKYLAQNACRALECYFLITVQ